MINKHEIECMMNYYYGNSQLEEIGYSELKRIDDDNNLKRIYGIYDEDERDAWYLICTKKGKSKILPYNRDGMNSNKIVEQFKNNTEFFHIRTDLLKKHIRGIYPLFYKNDEVDYKRKINCEEYLKTSEYPFCYAKYGRNYIACSNYNNIFVVNKVETEEKAILSLMTACECDDKVEFDDLFKYVVDNRNYDLSHNEDLSL